ncbi:hypothetical protein COCSADRAFT_355216 [Bipolaris sorokiniana ND90Pr]|uniref:Uncharacterized protein n=1 Tax=Cochliobolus sativus (strain ND90Pr / ATCC 201652) TaxID=665912 RepID=M2RGE1_COCSN|nr:uncharacterized protein COCSADRAFT_355216 [Bipolaris sorokiniana ND90Pr]EMD65829.1 hypothetical protein COCSADRAFT_355216 [Bipolaris sorokiniana ND90Pr]
MDSIVSKVRVELVELAETYAANKHENVTIRLISGFQRALFAILHESIRIKDFEQSKELRDEMIELFEDEYPTEPAWPYLNRLEKQDRCFAKLGCIFKHGAALYKSPFCQEHFVCENHKSSPCIAKHGNVAGQKHQVKYDIKDVGNIALDVENASTKQFIGGEISKEIPRNRKSDQTNAYRRLLGTRDLEQEKLPKSLEVEAIGMSKPFEYSWYSWKDNFEYHTDSSSSDQSESEDDVIKGEEQNWQNADIGR